MDLPKLNKLYPDFLVVGAAKSGTSSLDQYFRQHPDIYMPELIKELNFFHLKGHEHERAILKRVRYLPTNELSYLGHFYNKKKNQISGECSPSYLIYYEDTIENIKELHLDWKNLKIIIILREPIDKIWSHYKFVRMKGLDPENLTLDESLQQETKRLKNKNLLPDLFYINNTSYYEQVKAFLENFNYVKIINYDELKRNPNEVVKSAFDFLGVNKNIQIDTSKRHNASKPILNYKSDLYKKIANNSPIFLHRLIPSTFKNKLKVEEKMSSEVKTVLAENFLPEIQKLKKVTNMDFSDWEKKYKNILSE